VTEARIGWGLKDGRKQMRTDAEGNKRGSIPFGHEEYIASPTTEDYFLERKLLAS